MSTRLLQSRFLPSSIRLFSTSPARPAFATGPAPPRLPPKEQEEFERLQRSSTGAFSTPRPAVTTNPSLSSSALPRPRISQSPQTSAAAAPSAAPTRTLPQINQSPASRAEPSAETVSVSAEDIEVAAVNARVQATGKGEELHPDVRRGAKPEFEGDINPVTGEVGGPKNEPLRWGSTGQRGDWSYNGRVTDF